MNNFKRILVGLDLSEMDQTLIHIVQYLAGILELEKVYFMHVAKSLEIPKNMIEKYPDLMAPVDEAIKREIQQTVDSLLVTNPSFEYAIEVKEGNASDQILRWSDIKEVDLMLLGKKLSLKGKGILPGKLVKLGHCSVMFIPETMKPEINKVLAPIDFSKNSRHIIDVASHIADKAKAEIVLQHSYSVPTGYHAAGKSYEEFAELMRIHAKEDLMELLGQDHYALGKMIYTLDEDGDAARQIEKVANEQKADLVVVGSQGRSGLASILLGSVAEKVAKGNHKYSILIVKNHKENMGFFEALMRV